MDNKEQGQEKEIQEQEQKKESRSRNRKLTPRNGNIRWGTKEQEQKQDTREVVIDDDIGKYFC